MYHHQHDQTLKIYVWSYRQFFQQFPQVKEVLLMARRLIFKREIGGVPLQPALHFQLGLFFLPVMKKKNSKEIIFTC